MKTTKAERADRLRRDGFYNRASKPENQFVYRLIADVEDARGLLGIVLEEIKNGEIETNYSQRVCAKSIANFLKEPSDGD